MLLISRKDAKIAGSTHYYTGEACTAGHVTGRWTSSATCVECERLRRAKNAPRNRERVALWRQDNPERFKANSAKWRCENPNKVRAMKRKWRASNREVENERTQAWRRANPESARKSRAKSRAKRQEKIGPQIATLPAGVLRDVLSYYAKTPVGYHVDHIVPLNHPKVSGLHRPDNLLYLEPEANQVKSNYFNPNEHPFDEHLQRFVYQPLAEAA